MKIYLSTSANSVTDLETIKRAEQKRLMLSYLFLKGRKKTWDVFLANFTGREDGCKYENLLSRGSPTDAGRGQVCTEGDVIEGSGL